MKKLYNQPEWKVLFIEEDIVTESVGFNGPVGEEGTFDTTNAEEWNWND